MMFGAALRRCSMALTLALCGTPGFAGGLTLAHPYWEGSPFDLWARDLGACLESKAHLYTEVVGGGKLGQSPDLVDAVSQGFIDIAIVPATALRERWPDLSRLGESEPIFNPAEMMQLSRSSRFLRDVNQGGTKAFELAVISIGWQYSILAGVGGRLDDVNLPGAKILVPDSFSSRFSDQSSLLEDVIRGIGAQSIRLEASDVADALRFRAVDGAIMGTGLARQYMDEQVFDQLQWSPDFLPLASPVVVLMNTSSFGYQEIAERFPEVLSTDGCLGGAEAFSKQALTEVEELVVTAPRRGVQIVDVTPTWRDAFHAAIAARQQGGDPVSAAVRAELHR